MDSLEQMLSDGGDGFRAPYVPLRIIEALGLGALSPFQRPSVRPADPGGRFRMPSAIAVPGSVRDPAEYADTSMVNAIQADLGIPEVVAVLDTGIRTRHPAVRRLIIESVDLVGEPGLPAWDNHGHGTMASAVIALMSPHVQIINIKVANARGKTDRDRLARGIEEALAREPNRISISLGFEHACSRFWRCKACKAAEKAAAKGCQVFASPGNTAGVRACPARATGVHSIAAGVLSSPYAGETSLTLESIDRLAEGGATDEQMAARALAEAAHFIDAYEKRYSAAPADANAWKYLESALTLAKEASRLDSRAKDPALDVLERVIDEAQRFPLDVMNIILEKVWHHVPGSLLEGLRRSVRSATLEGTSFSIATASAMPWDLSARVRDARGEYVHGELASIARAAYSGDGEYIGIDGRFLMVPFEAGLMQRAFLLQSLGRIDDALLRFEPYAQPPRHPEDFLELALLHLMRGDGKNAVGALDQAIALRKDWRFAQRLRAQLV